LPRLLKGYSPNRLEGEFSEVPHSPGPTPIVDV
jgi:hypothetical protein